MRRGGLLLRSGGLAHSTRSGEHIISNTTNACYVLNPSASSRWKASQSVPKETLFDLFDMVPNSRAPLAVQLRLNVGHHFVCMDEPMMPQSVTTDL